MDDLRRLLTEGVAALLRRTLGLPARRSPAKAGRRGAPAGAPAGGSYPGDFTGTPTISYAPKAGPDGDPGEVVWCWVPFEEDHSRGKDRPVLLIGHDGEWLLGVPLTSKDHDRDAAQEARAGRHWIDVGTGAWDRQGRPSEARTDRVIRVDPKGIRRTGAALAKDRFDVVARAVIVAAR